jgi:hypothetical protein
LHDTVVVLADGRRANKVELVTDEAQKVVPLRSNLSLAVSGAQIGTDLAEAALRASSAGSASGLRTQLADLAYQCASHVTELITPDTINEAHVKVGLLAGGFEGTKAFLVAGLFGTGMHRPDSVCVFAVQGTPQFIVLGGESAGAQDHFNERLSHVIKRVGDSGAANSELRAAILAAGYETVRYAAERDPSIGGRVQFRTLRLSHPEEMGYLGNL